MRKSKLLIIALIFLFTVPLMAQTNVDMQYRPMMFGSTISPMSNRGGAIDLGTSSYLWRVLYSNSLSLENGETIANSTDGKIDVGISSVSGSDGFYVQAVTTTGTAVNLKGIRARATATSTATSGTIKGIESSARAITYTGGGSGGGDLTEITAFYGSADVKGGTTGLLRGMEISLDGEAGGTATLAQGILISNNTSGAHTTDIALDINTGTASGHDAFDYDIRFQNGALVTNSTTSLLTITEAVTSFAGALRAILTTEQFRLSYDATNYATWTVAADGALTVTTVDASAAEGDINFNPDGLVGIKTAVPTVELDVTGAGAFSTDLAVDGTANLDNTDIDGTLTVDGTVFDFNATTTLSLDNTNASNGITINTATSAGVVSIGHTTSETTVNDNLNVTGDLAVDLVANLDNTDIDGTFTMDGTAFDVNSTTTVTIDNTNTTNGIDIGTSTSAVPIDIGHATSETTVGDNLNVTGNSIVGVTAPDEAEPYFAIRADADSDAEDTVDEFKIAITANATPTSAVWGFTSTQSAGYSFDKSVLFSAGLNLGTSQAIVATTGLTIGGGTETVAINSSDWDINATGDMSNIGRIVFQDDADRSGEGTTLFANGVAIGITTAAGDAQGMKMEYDYGVTPNVSGAGKTVHGMILKMVMDADWDFASADRNAVIRGAMIHGESEGNVGGRVQGIYANATAKGTSKTLAGYFADGSTSGGLIGIEARTELASNATITTPQVIGLLVWHNQKTGSELTGDYHAIQIDQALTGTISGTKVGIKMTDDHATNYQFDYGIDMSGVDGFVTADIRFSFGGGCILTSYAGNPHTNVTATKGSLCVDTTNGDLYVNTDGSTSWGACKN